MFDVWERSPLYSQYVKAFLASQHHLPHLPAKYTRSIWGGPAALPPNDEIEENIAGMLSILCGTPWCADCRRRERTQVTVGEAQARIAALPDRPC